MTGKIAIKVKLIMELQDDNKADDEGADDGGEAEEQGGLCSEDITDGINKVS